MLVIIVQSLPETNNFPVSVQSWARYDVVAKSTAQQMVGFLRGLNFLLATFYISLFRDLTNVISSLNIIRTDM